MKAQIPDETNCVPYHPNDIHSILINAPFSWWISGGWALDLFLQEQTRKHFDIDVSIARHDQLAAQVFLSSWDFWSVKRDESGEIVFSQWGRNEMLGNEYPGVWGGKIWKHRGVLNFSFKMLTTIFGNSDIAMQYNTSYLALDILRQMESHIFDRRLLC